TTNAVRAADLSVSKSAPATANAGTDITYTITVTNHGPSTSSGGTVSDSLPAGTTFVSASAGCAGTTTVVCTFGALAASGPSSSASFSITVHIDPSATGAIDNTATVSATNAAEDGNAANNSSTATTNAVRAADLSVSKSAPATANAGTDITYTITVTNHGPSTSSGGTVSDSLPTGTTFV